MSKEKPSCQSCNHHSSGIGATLKNGHVYEWQECKKSWGKTTPVGVFKNVCDLYMPKKGT